MGSIRIPLVLACATEVTHCGPNAQEQGQLVLLIAPLVFLCSLGVQWVILRLWQRRWPEVAPRWRPNLILFGALSVAAAVTVALGGYTGEAAIAFWLFGSSYLAVLLVSMRVCLLFAKRAAFTFAHIVPLVLYLGLAATLAVGGLPDTWVAKHSEDLFTMPGFGGSIPGGLFLLLLLEAAIRGRARRAV